MDKVVNLAEKLALFEGHWQPRTVERQPFAEEEVHMLLIEPTGTPNSGDPRTAAPRREI